MDVLKTISAVPEKTDTPHKVSGVIIDFGLKTVTFNITAIPLGSTDGTYFQKTINFSDVTPIITAPQKNTFVLVIRTALSIAMGVDISKIPLDIFAP